MHKKISIPAWLLLAAIFSQLLMAILNAHLIYQQATAPQVWRLDSVAYHTFLQGQGKLNLNFYMHQQDHEQRLRKLARKQRGLHENH
jgi:hypothetical protein